MINAAQKSNKLIPWVHSDLELAIFAVAFQAFLFLGTAYPKLECSCVYLGWNTKFGSIYETPKIKNNPMKTDLLLLESPCK